MKKTIDTVILILALLGLTGALLLVIADAVGPGVCPIALGVPACYFALALFLGINLGHVPLLKNERLKKILFLGFSGIGTLIAAYASLGRLFGFAECPDVGSLPLCYLALVAYLSLFILKIWSLRST